jgi:hypothetical protein
LQRLDRAGCARVMHGGVDRDGPVEAELPARDLVGLTVRVRVRLRLRLRLRLRVRMRIRLSIRVRVLRDLPGQFEGHVGEDVFS